MRQLLKMNTWQPIRATLLYSYPGSNSELTESLQYLEQLARPSPFYLPSLMAADFLRRNPLIYCSFSIQHQLRIVNRYFPY